MSELQEPINLIDSTRLLIAFARRQNPLAFAGEVRIASTLATRQALIDCRRKNFPGKNIPKDTLKLVEFFGYPCEWYHTDEGALFASLLNQDRTLSYIFIPTPK